MVLFNAYPPTLFNTFFDLIIVVIIISIASNIATITTNVLLTKPSK